MKRHIIEEFEDFVNIISLESNKKIDISNIDTLRCLATPQALHRLNKIFPLKTVNETLYRIKNTGAYVKVRKERYNRAFYCEFYNLKQYELNPVQESIKNEMIKYILNKKSFKKLSADIAIDDKKPLRINPFFIKDKREYKDTLYLSILGNKACIYNKYNKNPLKVNEKIIRTEITLKFCNPENTTASNPPAPVGKKTTSKNIKGINIKYLRSYLKFKNENIERFLDFHNKKTRFKKEKIKKRININNSTQLN